MDWYEDDENLVKADKWNKVCILKHMFTVQELEQDPTLLLDLKEEIREECEKLGEVTNVIIYDVGITTSVCLFNGMEWPKREQVLTTLCSCLPNSIIPMAWCLFGLRRKSQRFCVFKRCQADTLQDRGSRLRSTMAIQSTRQRDQKKSRKRTRNEDWNGMLNGLKPKRRTTKGVAEQKSKVAIRRKPLQLMHLRHEEQ